MPGAVRRDRFGAQDVFCRQDRSAARDRLVQTLGERVPDREDILASGRRTLNDQ